MGKYRAKLRYSNHFNGQRIFKYGSEEMDRITFGKSWLEFEATKKIAKAIEKDPYLIIMEIKELTKPAEKEETETKVKTKAEKEKEKKARKAARAREKRALEKAAKEEAETPKE